MDAPPQNPPAARWKPPEFFEEYQLKRRVGRGGFGDVYLGHDLLLERPVAVKFISRARPDSRMRERFLSEARAAARLQHPNVVSVYRVGEVQGRLFIVSEFVRGRSLAALQRPIPSARVLAIGIGLTRGLGAAHRAGVLHRDIKPGNVALTHDGEPKLLDFGIAKLLSTPETESLSNEEESFEDDANANNSRSGSGELSSDNLYAQSQLAGTPLYMAPEVLLGEPATRRSDIYAIGVLLFELYVGVAPFRELLSEPAPHPPAGTTSSADAVAATQAADVRMSTFDRLRQLVMTTPAPPVLSRLPDADPELAAVIDRCLRRNPAERFAGADELREALEALLQPARKEAMPEGNPYRGLRPFESQHRAFYFGRKAEIGTVIDRLRTESWLVVTADSGIGKSSLCKAGVLPLIESGSFDSRRAWKVVSLVPGTRPLQGLAERLSTILELEEQALITALRSDPLSLPRLLRRALGSDRGLLIFFDQLEELVTVSEPRESAVVTAALGALGGGIDGVRLLATVRSDFLARVAMLPGLRDDFLRNVYLLRAMNAANLREAVVGPAQLKNVTFESDGLVNELVDSVARTAGALPLLQFALAELWEVRAQDRITAQSLASLGGVTGALARHADHVLSSLPPEKRSSARRILMSLVTLDNTRARQSHKDLTESDPHAGAALEALVRGRLLVATDTPEGPAYEVSHEALISDWATLRGWLTQHAEARAVKERLKIAVADWERQGRPADLLWTARQLLDTRLLEKGDTAPREAEFIAVSQRSAERQRRLRQLLLASLPVLLIVLYGIVRLLSSRDLDRRASANFDEGQRLFREGQTQDQDKQKLRLHAFALFDQMDREAGELAWTRARKKGEEVDRLYARATGRLEAALSLDSRRSEVRRLLTEAIYSRALLAEEQDAQALLQDLLQRLELYDPDGPHKQQWNAPGHLTIDTLPSGAQVRIERYVEDERGKQQLRERRELGTTPLVDQALAPGSYLITLRASGGVDARYPLLIERGEALKIKVPLLDKSAIPAGYVYVPPGRFLFGAGGVEMLRQKFFNTAPRHTVWTGGFLIGEQEITFREYIEFLNSMPLDEREKYRPKVAGDMNSGAMELTEVEGGRWQLTMQASTVVHRAVSGAPIVYDKRTQRVRQDWLRFPVVGISASQAVAYAAWLQRSGKLDGARLCTEQEWERAARGADDREYTSGSTLDPDDANHDQTYGNQDTTKGPDEVGSHPRSKSPFGVDDMIGNAIEVMSSSLTRDEVAMRGGGFPWDPLSCRLINRNPVEKSFRAPYSGFRLCVTLQRKDSP